MNTSPDTIVAIATPPGRGGVGVVRVSGNCAAGIAERMTQKTLLPRCATFAAFRDMRGAVLDEGLALWFPAPHSYTGEDTLELQGHGSPFVLDAVVTACIEVGGERTRRAAPGEYTQRAFLNGKLDLAQAEAVADLIDAGSRAAARAAMNSLSGAFSAHIQSLQAKLIHLRMFTEATLDFPEEELEFLQAEKALEKAHDVNAALAGVLAQAQQGQLLHDGIRIVLVGAPNVGKSALLNRLAGDEIAIVTAIAGTTRDTVRARISLHGLPCEVIDTAGIRETSDPVEKIGIERTLAAIASADVVLLIADATTEKSAIAVEIAPLVRAALPQSVPVVHVLNKIDQAPLPLPAAQNAPFLAVSALRGDGIEALIGKIVATVGFRAQFEGAFTARARHVEALHRTRKHIANSLYHLETSALELFAEELRLAHRALGEVLGEFTADDLLGEIFGKFCIGK